MTTNTTTKRYYINHLRDGSICLGDRVTLEFDGTYQEAVNEAHRVWAGLKQKAAVTVHADPHCLSFWHAIWADGRAEDRNTNSGVSFPASAALPAPDGAPVMPEPSADELVANQARDAAIFGRPQSFEEQQAAPLVIEASTAPMPQPRHAGDICMVPLPEAPGQFLRYQWSGLAWVDSGRLTRCARCGCFFAINFYAKLCGPCGQAKPTLFEQAQADEAAGNHHAAAEGYRLAGNDHREAGRMADAESLYACARRCLEAADPTYKARRARLLKRRTSRAI